jgi:hypothetical protein
MVEVCTQQMTDALLQAQPRVLLNRDASATSIGSGVDAVIRARRIC